MKNRESEEEDEFEKELNVRERRQKAKQAVQLTSSEEALKYVLSVSRMKTKTVFEAIEMYPEPVKEMCAVLSSMPVTQVTVERLFSAMKIIMADQRSVMGEN